MVQPVGRLQVAQPPVVLDVGETHVLHLEQSKGEDKNIIISFFVFINSGAADDPSVSQSIFTTSPINRLQHYPRSNVH